MELRRFFSPSTVGLGTAIAAASSALSFLFAFIGLGRPYYASVFMPLIMICLLALAWFMYLRDDGLARRPPASGRPSGASGAPATGAESEPWSAEPVAVGGLDLDGGAAGSAAPYSVLFVPRSRGLVPRAPVAAPAGRRLSVRGACVWAAFELGAASAVLYAATGLGASFFQ